jgi:glycosyltransferase involved in cell wall biosynthesis
MNKVALVMIVRNEARCIARCLRSAMPFVDEMIVLDTGSTDATVRIARDIGAQVRHFTWVADFAAARNAALGYSSARWNLILDADEWISDAASRTEFAAALDVATPFVGLLPIHSEFDLQGRVEVEKSWIPRLLPDGVRYQGTIHEQPVSSLAWRRLELPIFHDGYRRDLAAQKKGRNESLLLTALESKPADSYLLYQLGKNYEAYEDYAKAVVRYRQALALTDTKAMYRHALVVRAIFAMKMAQLHEDAIRLAETEMDNWQHSPDFFFVLGDLLLDWANLNPATAFQHLLPIVESSWLKCLELGDQPALAGSVMGRGSHLAAHNLAVLYAGLGDAKQAAHYKELAARR